MKTKRILLAAFSLVLALTMLFCATGCSGLGELMEMYGGSELETLEEGQSIYELSLFDELPEENAGIDPLFWVAEGDNGNKVYFLGSIHVADESAYRLPEYIMNAFLQSDSLAVECDILAFESDLVSQYSLMQYYMYSDGTTIEDHIDPELYKKIVAYFDDNPSASLEEYGYTADVLKQCKPCMWSSCFDTMSVDASGLDSDLGIDHHFLSIATSMGKNIIELESVEFQYKMLDDFSDELDEFLLRNYVSSTVDESAQSLVELFSSWKTGAAEELADEEEDYTIDTSELSEEDLEEYNLIVSDYVPQLGDYYTEAQLKELYAEGYTDEYLATVLYYFNVTVYEYDELLEEYNNAMITERNKGMANLAGEMLGGGEDVFYVVGAGHMVDYDYAEGVITQVRNMGYTVTQIGGQGKDESYDLSYLFEDGVVPETVVTSTSTAANDDSTTTATSAQSSDEYDYELYEEMFEYFGGTTRPDEEPTTTTTKASTTSARTTTTTNNGGWGWSGN